MGMKKILFAFILIGVTAGADENLTYNEIIELNSKKIEFEMSKFNLEKQGVLNKKDLSSMLNEFLIKTSIFDNEKFKISKNDLYTINNSPYSVCGNLQIMQLVELAYRSAISTKTESEINEITKTYERIKKHLISVSLLTDEFLYQEIMSNNKLAME